MNRTLDPKLSFMHAVRKWEAENNASWETGKFVSEEPLAPEVESEAAKKAAAALEVKDA